MWAQVCWHRTTRRGARELIPRASSEVYEPTADDYGATLLVELIPYFDAAAAARAGDGADDGAGGYSSDESECSAVFGPDSTEPPIPAGCTWGKPVYASTREVTLDGHFEAVLTRMCAKGSADFEVVTLPPADADGGAERDASPGAPAKKRTLSLRARDLQLSRGWRRDARYAYSAHTGVAIERHDADVVTIEALHKGGGGRSPRAAESHSLRLALYSPAERDLLVLTLRYLVATRCLEQTDGGCQ